MVMIGMDLPYDAYASSGSFNQLNPPAIHLVLTENDLQDNDTLYQGSGGSVSARFSSSPTGTTTIIIQKAEPKLDSSLRAISSAFSLTKEELATVLQIQSKKTLYNWINGGATPRKSSIQRIFKLITIVKTWNHSNIKLKKEQLHKPIIDGLSIYDMLSAKTLDSELILFSGSRLSLQTQSTQSLIDPFA